MWSLRTRYLWLTVVSVIYVLFVFVLQRRLHHLDVADVSDVAVVKGVQTIFDDGASHVDEPLSLAFPVVRRCIGPSFASPSQLLPVGSDWLYTAYFDDRLKSNTHSVHGVIYIRVLALLRRRLNLDQKPVFYFRWQQSETGNTMTATAEMYEMCENHGRRYGGWILSTRFVGQLPPCSIVVMQDHNASDRVRLPVFRMSAEEWSRVEEDNLWPSNMSPPR